MARIEGEAGLTRRRALQAGALAAGALWLPSGAAAAPARRCPAPRGFPADIELSRELFENWSTAIRVPDVWTCAPRNAREVVDVVNWAYGAGWRVRPRGKMHNWSPLTLEPDSECGRRILLVDTTRHLRRIEVLGGDPAAVRVEAGALMDDLVARLSERGYGFASMPAPGGITVGGALAIGGHGSSLPGRGESRPAGQTYGSLSNQIVSLRAIVWDRDHRRYRLREFHRSERDTAAFCVHLGRAFVVAYTLRVGSDRNLRCVSLLDIPADELFAPPRASARTFAGFVDTTGRAEAIWFPFTERPWLKVWSVAPTKPPASRAVDAPYNYPFSDSLSREASDALRAQLLADPSSTPGFGQSEYQAVVSGLAANDSADIWGASKNTLLYIRPTTLRLEEIGYAVLTRRRHVQRVIHEFTSFFSERIAAYRDAGRFPINGPVEIRVSGLDRPAHVEVAGAKPPPLSSLVPSRGSGWHAAVWFNVLSFPGTDHEYAFFRELERFLLDNYRGGHGLARPEWSKVWAFTRNAAFADDRLIGNGFPRRYRRGRPRHADWDWALRTLDRYDPHRVFGNGFVDRLTAV